MSTRQIEDCYDREAIEEKQYNQWIRLLIPKGYTAVIVDPYIISIKDLVNLVPGRVGIVKVRRSEWGQRDIINSFIQILEV